jgi:hypothetical protein
MRYATYVGQVACVSLIVLGAAAPIAHAADILCPPVAGAEPIPKNGFVREKSIGNPTNFRIDWTDRSGAAIGVGSVTGTTKRVGTSNIFLSDVIKAPSALGVGPNRTIVCDFIQTTDIAENTGEVNVLAVEAITFDQAAGEFATANIFEALSFHVGDGIFVPIPDLYADTNGDGALGLGDILFSAVDLNEYLLNVPTFLLGQTFNIVNGLVPELPGMFFSSTPISFDPTTGEFLGTPISIDASALSSHEVESIPEPGTLALFLAGLASASVIARRRSRHGSGCDD